MRAIEIKTVEMPVSNAVFMAAWLKDMEEQSNGKIKFTYYEGGGKIGGPLFTGGADLLQAVADSKVDLCVIMTSYLSEELPLSGIFGIPFLYGSTEVAAAVGWELLEKYMADTEYKNMNIKPLWLTVPGILNLHFASRPVHKLEDLKHMKFNVHGVMPPNAFRALGGDPVDAEAYEFADFTKRGLLDGVLQNWASPFDLKGLTKYSIGNSNVWTTGMPYVMNLNKWESLPPDIQKLFEDNSGLKKSREVGAAFDKRNSEHFEKFKKEGREIYYLPEDERARWVKAVQPVITDWINAMEAKGLPGKAIVEDARKLANRYTEKA